MKHAIIVAHPNPDSFNLTMARAYKAAVEHAGHRAELRDLYRIGFDPRMGAGEIPQSTGFKAADDVQAERASIGGADVFIFVYPLWLNSPPAMMKGYMERVFGMGFAYGPGGGTEPLLAGRRMISITSSGAPKDWVVDTGAWQALRKLFDERLEMWAKSESGKKGSKVMSLEFSNGSLVHKVEGAADLKLAYTGATAGVFGLTFLPRDLHDVVKALLAQRAGSFEVSGDTGGLLCLKWTDGVGAYEVYLPTATASGGLNAKRIEPMRCEAAIAQAA